jgi:hypothetical protein
MNATLPRGSGLGREILTFCLLNEKLGGKPPPTGKVAFL